MNAPKGEKKPRAQRQSAGETDAAHGLLHEAFSELENTVEELRVAEEELRSQNEALGETALALDAERRRYRDLFESAPEPSLLTDLNGLVQEANNAVLSLLGVGLRSLTGKPLATYIALQSRRVFRTELLGSPPAERERGLWLQPRQGPTLYATLRVSPVPGPDGAPSGLRWLVRGVIPDPRAELERYRRLVDEVKDFAIFTLDAQNLITSWNAGAEQIFGFFARETLGRSGAIIFTAEDREAGAPEEEIGRAVRDGRAEDERWHVRKDGSRFWGSGVLTAMPDGAGGPLWFAKIVRDQTERRLHEQREHAVATQLQAAVQPAVPPRLPGLGLHASYRPALDEASVGGDFFDAFSLSDGRTALAVGDVSGKGLEAAAQVATIRNMLRFALYNHPSLKVSVAALNRTLAEHGLLTGFATLFIGLYDAGTRTLAYINCGQEPALVRRAATGQVDHLPHTGPLLGMHVDSEFPEGVATLMLGDVLAVFTDGLTDVGPNRREMLGVEGLAALLAGTTPKNLPDFASALIAGVDAFSQGVVYDDQCLLLAVAE